MPCREMAALRDRIIRGYFSIDYSIVWNVITVDLSLLGPTITTLLKKPDTMPDRHRPSYTKP